MLPAERKAELEFLDAILQRIPELQTIYEMEIGRGRAILPYYGSFSIADYLAEKVCSSGDDLPTWTAWLLEHVEEAVIAGPDCVRNLVCTPFVDKLVGHDDVVARLSLRGLLGRRLAKEIESASADRKAEQEFFDAILQRAPELQPIYDESVGCDDELLAHIAMSNIAEYFAERVRSSGDDWPPWIVWFLEHAEEAMVAGPECVRNVICVSFLEMLAGDDDVVARLSLRGLFGRKLVKGLRDIGW